MRRPLRSLHPSSRCLATLAIGLVPWAVHAGCPIPPDATASASAGPVQARWSTEPAQVQVGEPFVMRVELCPAAAKLLRVDATMPEHRHGMNYQPSVKPLGQGLWQVEGMVWHMAGRWELKLDTELNGVAHRLAPSVTLK